MDIKELLKKDPKEVRRNPHLILLYIEAFKIAFGYTPACTGCTFSADWDKLSKYILLSNKNNVSLDSLSNNKNIKNMEKTHQLKTVSNTILHYKKDKVTHRSYDNKMTDEFAIAFLSNGTKEQLAERKKMFKILPEGFEAVTEPLKVVKDPDTLTEVMEPVESPENNHEETNIAPEVTEEKTEAVTEPLKVVKVKKPRVQKPKK